MRYSFEVGYIQMKENEEAFLNTMRLATKKYGLRHERNKEELDGPHIYAKDLTPDKIKELAKAKAIDTMNRFKQDGKDILYTVAAMFSLFNGYNPEKGKRA